MTHPDSSDDHQQQTEVIYPALPRQADGPPPKTAAQLAASGPGFKIAATFQAEQTQRLDGYPRWASGLPLFPAARADLVFQQAISKMAGCSPGEVTRRLGLPANAVRVHLHHARGKVRARLEAAGIRVA